ncbi:MAG: ATP-binding cassette domain-containing protein, partial [Deltaproteobacteria bacterium]|nr:ATP-binding cassette domain-containing protein [Deltaproteobacteria bacterium]
FGGQHILSSANLRIGEGEKIGLIGPNGSGKSTLLKLLLGEQTLDSGAVRHAKGARLGYLPQDVLEVAGDTLLRSVLDTVPGRADISTQISETEAALEASSDPDEQMEFALRLGDLVELHEHFETHYSEREAIRILLGIGFRETDLVRPTEEFSGGWKMRAALAGLLFQRPDVLFLDEPTNHLDIPSVRWLNDFLLSYKSAVVLISHDRDFLNRQISRVISFEPEGLRLYRGDYEAYLEQRAEEEEVLGAQRRNQERELKELERFVERFKAKATKARQAQSRARRVRRLQAEMAANMRPTRNRGLSFSFPEVARTGRDVVTLKGITKAFGDLRLYEDVSHGVYAGDRIAIIGVNGAGKTTLLKIMAGELAPDAGDVRYGSNVQLGYYAQHHTELLDRRRTVLEEVRQMVPDLGESYVRGVCGAFLFSGDDVDKSVGVLSGGERARVLLARLLVRPGNLLMMDEPTNHLDLAAAEALAKALSSFGGTVLFVSHNTAFVNRLATKIWDISEGTIVEYPGTLDEYFEHVRRWEEEKAQVPRGPAGRPLKSAQRTAPSTERPEQKKKQEEQRAQKKKQEQQQKQKQQKQKQQKRREAEQRNELGRRTRKFKEDIARLEDRVNALELEQSALEPQLADPELYQDQKRFKETFARFDENRTKLEELYGRWDHRQRELDEAVASFESEQAKA